MLGHNETQLDSYNKNIPKAHGKYNTTQEHSSQIGTRKEFIEIIEEKPELSLKIINPKNIRIYSSQIPFLYLAPKMIPNTAF
jgi:hypothetical protein